MKTLMSLCALVVLGLATGCGAEREAPLVSGTLEGGTFWNNPQGSPNNSGGSYAQGSRVEIFESFVVVTTKDGASHVHPQGFYTNLKLKKD